MSGLPSTPNPPTIARSYKYRLYPTAAQEHTLIAWQEACWEVQRLCITQRRWAWRNRRTLYSGKPGPAAPSWASQGREVTELRQHDPWLADVPSDTMRDIVQRVDQAYQRMFENIKQGKKGGTPRWADRAADVGLMFRGQVDRGTRMVAQHRRFAWWTLSAATGRLGKLKVRYHRSLPADADIRQVYITHAADGWYISFACIIPLPPPPPPVSKDVNGVDLGCIHTGDIQRIAAVDDGRIYTSTDGLKREARRLRLLQRRVDPKRKVQGMAKAADPHSKRTARRRTQIARLHQRVARQREHVQQYVARRLVDTAETTAFEAIDWTALRSAGKHKKRSHTKKRGSRRAKCGLNRAMMTASPGRLIALTQEKAAAAGRKVVKVNPRNTSQDCSVCGKCDQKKDLSIRTWQCGHCGITHDRDINAAQNIRQRAVKQDAGLCQPGVRGEGVASDARERRSVNREGQMTTGGATPRRRLMERVTTLPLVQRQLWEESAI